MKVRYNLLSRRPRDGVEVYFYSFFNFGASWGWWSTPRPGRSTLGKDPVTIVWEGGWDAGPVWTGAENLASTGIRSPDRPVRSQSLYRLSYRGHVGSDKNIYNEFSYLLCNESMIGVGALAEPN